MTGPDSLMAWQVADRLSREVLRISTERWAPGHAFAWDQARRAALSASLNLVEGYAWRPGGRWVYHLRVANGSALELIYAVRFLRDIGAVEPEVADELLALGARSKRLIWGLLAGSEGQK